jgi:hypothetical protein
VIRTKVPDRNTLPGVPSRISPLATMTGGNGAYTEPIGNSQQKENFK